MTLFENEFSEFNHDSDKEKLSSDLFTALEKGKGKFCTAKKITPELDIYTLSIHPSADIHGIKKEIHHVNVFSGNSYDVVSLKADILSKDKSEVFLYKGIACNLVSNEETTVLNESNCDSLYVGIQYPDRYIFLENEKQVLEIVVRFALGTEEYKLFEAYTSVPDKDRAIKEYAKLTSPQKQFFKAQFNRPKIENVKNNDIYTPIKSEKALRMLFETCQDTYDENTRVKAKLILSELDSHVSQSDRAVLINQLSHLLCIDTQPHHSEYKTFDEIINLFNQHIYGLNDFKERFAEFLYAAQYTKTSNIAILLVGPPGVGKTSIGNVTALCCSKPFIHIDCSGADCLAMNGLVKTYSGAKPGKIIESLYEKGQTDAVILLDEIDKLAITKEGNPYSVFLKALGPQKLLHDEFLDADIDVSKSVFIATSNELSAIPGYIVNRFGDNIFFLDKYSNEEKVAIAKAHLIKSVLDENNISESDLIFSDDALKLIASDYCTDEGMREMAGYLTTIVRKVRRYWGCESTKKPFLIDESFVKDNLLKKEKPTQRKMGFQI